MKDTIETAIGILTKREKAILTLIADGFSSRKIASKLFVSTNTISHHRANMLRKTSCKNSEELVKYAIKAGLI